METSISLPVARGAAASGRAIATIALLMVSLTGCSGLLNQQAVTFAYRPFAPAELDGASVRNASLIRPTMRDGIRFEEVALAPPVFPPIKLRDTPQVREQLRAYTAEQRSFVLDGLERRSVHHPLIKAELDKRGLPEELANVAFIESRYIPDAKSGRGAVGLWQFMKLTAKRFGLRVSLLQDERKDPVKSTQAAAEYLSYLYDRFDDWFLAIAAYNAGPARVSQATKRCGSRDIFELAVCGALKRETIDFVARFIAITLITRHPDVYGFEEEWRQLREARSGS